MIEIYEEVKLSQIEITDEFFGEYVSLVKNVIIPYQWDILNDPKASHCIRNFKIASGELSGEFKGAVFQDSDLAKWLEAVAYCLATSPDKELEMLADQMIDLIARAQQEDGYLNTYFTIKEPDQKFLNLQEGHELYTAGHMIEAAVAYYQATGKDRFLQVVCRQADLFCQVFGEEAGKCHGYPGHQEIELALIKLYRVTGMERYLQLAQYFIDIRGVGENYFKEEEKRGKKRIFPEFEGYDPLYSQSHLPVREQKTAEGHAVRAVYMYCAMADLAGITKDQTLLKSCKELWDNIVNKRMYITGGIGSSGLWERFTTDYDLPNDRNYSETCASIGMALFGNRMARITKDASYLDVVELELYNTILAGIALDGKHFFYVNPLEVWPDNCLPRTSLEHVKAERQKWFGVACCPPNIARTLASLGQYLYFKEADCLYLNLYISNCFKTEIDHKQVMVELESRMPRDAGGRIKVDTSHLDKTFQMAIRVPFYGKNFAISEKGQPIKTEIRAGYCYIAVEPGYHQYTIGWDMDPIFVYSNPNVRANCGKAAITRGPIVYCLEEVDNGSNLSALFIDTGNGITEHNDGDIPGDLPWLELYGKRQTVQNWHNNDLYGCQKPVFIRQSLKAVPYFYWNNRKAGEMQVWIKEII